MFPFFPDWNELFTHLLNSQAVNKDFPLIPLHKKNMLLYAPLMYFLTLFSSRLILNLFLKDCKRFFCDTVICFRFMLQFAIGAAIILRHVLVFLSVLM